MSYKFLIVGAGFSGSVIARHLAESHDCKIDVIDKRNHIAGNCYTERDKETNVTVHKYGPHIFNTSIERVWQYVNSFAEFEPYTNRVKACSNGSIFSFPINLATINQLFNKQLSPLEAERFIREQAISEIKNPRNFEEQALSMVGEKIYKTFFYGYTKKQWGCSPKNLPASILKRLPIRFDYNDSYYNKKWQGIPKEGYTELVNNILDHKNISLNLETEFESVSKSDYDWTFYSGPIDQYFNYSKGKLGYRTVYFEEMRSSEIIQGNAVINYCDEDIPWTRIHEHRYFQPNRDDYNGSIAFKEYSKETTVEDEPYYPKHLEADRNLFNIYSALALREEKITFIGRLGTYQYLDMDRVINQSLTLCDNYLQHLDFVKIPKIIK